MTIEDSTVSTVIVATARHAAPAALRAFSSLVAEPVRGPQLRRAIGGFAAVALLVFSLPAGASASSSLRVPADYPTIQSAVNAAHSGDTVSVAAGTFNEQVVIAKDLRLTGAGGEAEASGEDEAGGDGETFGQHSDAQVTTIKAPAALVAGPLDSSTSIVAVVGGAHVKITGLTIAGPGTQPCGSATRLRRGILVGQNATLDLEHAAVRDIRATPVGTCTNAAIKIGLDGRSGTKTPGHATIAHDSISGYEHEGINVSGPNSTATISHNQISGVGGSPAEFISGITIQLGGTATIVHNTITDNHCTSSAEGCGPDLIHQFQDTGILVHGPGTVIAHNRLSHNDAGIALFRSPNCCSLSYNVLSDNLAAGYEIGDGDQTISHDAISGGEVGVFVVAESANTTVTLDHVSIAESSLAPTQTYALGGFTAQTVIR
jgi:Right handed beta helix region